MSSFIQNLLTGSRIEAYTELLDKGLMEQETFDFILFVDTTVYCALQVGLVLLFFSVWYWIMSKTNLNKTQSETGLRDSESQAQYLKHLQTNPETTDITGPTSTPIVFPR